MQATGVQRTGGNGIPPDLPQLHVPETAAAAPRRKTVHSFSRATPSGRSGVPQRGGGGERAHAEEGVQRVGGGGEAEQEQSFVRLKLHATMENPV